MAAVVLTAEIGARVLEAHLPAQTGSEQRAIVKARQMRERGHTQIAIVGSSEAAAGIDPEVLLREAPGFTSAYNAGLVGSHLSASDRWFRRIVRPELTPDVVIIGVLPLAILSYDDVDDETVFGTDDEADAWLRETKRTFLETSRAYESTFERIAPGFFRTWGPRLTDSSALLRNRTRLRSPSGLSRAVRNLVGASDDRATDISAQIGPTGQNLEYSEPGDRVPTEGEVELYRAAMRQPLDLETLGSLVDAIRESNADPVVALAPIDRASLRRDGLEIGEWDARLDELRTWARRADVPLHDHFVIEYSGSDFHDRHHLGRSGAMRWSTELGRFIDRLCDEGRLRACRPD